MDQKSFYEFQTGGDESLSVDSDAALIGRDSFITDDISGRIDVAQRPNVAELSIGEGRLSQSLLRCSPNLQLNCIDISTVRIDYVRRLLESNPDVNHCNARFTECNFDTQFNIIESGAYDFVIALDVMEHVLDVFGFVENCHRILAKDGVLFLRVPNIAYIKHRLRLLRGILPVTASWFGTADCFDAWREQHGWDGGHLHLFTIPILVQLLTETGFSVAQCRDPGTSFSRIRDLWPNGLYSNPLIVAGKIE